MILRHRAHWQLNSHHESGAVQHLCRASGLLPPPFLSGWGFKGENYGKGRWTQTQLHTGDKDKGEQKMSFILKLSPKTKSRQNARGKAATKRKQDKVQTK